MRTILMSALLAVGLLTLSACAGNPDPVTTPIQTVGDYGVRVEKFASQMQQTVAQSPLSDDIKAKAMVGFRDVGGHIASLGRALSAYDAALKLNQPVDGTEPAKLAEQVKNGLLAVVTVVRGGDAAVANQLNTTYVLVEQLIVELRTKLRNIGGQ